MTRADAPVALLPAVVQVKASGVCSTHSRTHVAAASHTVTVDEPFALGGTNLGPTPIQMLLASWLGCINVMLHRIAGKHGIELQGLTLDAEATLRTDGVRLAAELSVPLERLTLKLASAQEPAAGQRELLLGELQRYCPISKMLRNSGTEIVTAWDTAPG